MSAEERPGLKLPARSKSVLLVSGALARPLGRVPKSINRALPDGRASAPHHGSLIDQMKRHLCVLRIEDRMISFSVVRNDLIYVALSLGIRGHALILIDGSFTSVVPSEGKLNIAVESL